MKTIYLTRAFQPLVVDAPAPGDSHRHPDFGDCRRLTASRFCLAAERAGKGSEAILGLLEAVRRVAKDDIYDGRPLESWYGLIGLPLPPPKEPEYVRTICPKCGAVHYPLVEDGEVWNGGYCLIC